MAAIEVAFKSPLIPLCQRGELSPYVFTPPFDELRASFGTRGRGDFSGQRENYAENSIGAILP
jgi:hypothetical protein